MQLIKLRCNNCSAQLDIDLDNLQIYCPYCGQKLMIGFDQLGKVLAEKEKTKRTIEREEQQTRRVQMAYEHEARERDKERKATARGNVLPWVFLITLGLILPTLYFGSAIREHKQKVANLQEIEIEIEEAIQKQDYDLALLKANNLYLDDQYSSEETATWDAKRKALLEIIEEKQRESNLNDTDNIFMPAKSSFFEGKDCADVVDQLKALGFTNISTQIASKSPGWFTKNNTVEHILIGGKTEFTQEDYFNKDTSIIVYYCSK